MSAKTAKAVRRQIRREAAKAKPAIINKFLSDAKDWPFRARFGVAWALLRRKKLEVVK